MLVTPEECMLNGEDNYYVSTSQLFKSCGVPITYLQYVCYYSFAFHIRMISMHFSNWLNLIESNQMVFFAEESLIICQILNDMTSYFVSWIIDELKELIQIHNTPPAEKNVCSRKKCQNTPFSCAPQIDVRKIGIFS